jgi:hypothetical protein
MVRHSPLDDPRNAAHAWARFKRLNQRMAVAAVLVALLSDGLLYVLFGAISIHFYIAVGLGIGAMMLLTGLLMGLVFMSSGTGHDDAIGEAPEEPRLKD